MGLWCDETTPKVRRAAILAYQLPSDSRVWRAMVPAGAHSTDTLLLRQIELDLRAWHWANTEEAKDQSTAPKPIRLAGEDELEVFKFEQAMQAAQDVAAAFGLGV